MTRPIAVLRPEPGNAATAARIETEGLTAISLPLFAVHPLDWTAPDLDEHDALLITSANTLVHGGPELLRLRALPVFAVGASTAGAARDAGFDVMAVGDRDAAAMLDLARERGRSRLLHLGGRDRSIEVGGIVTRAIAIYVSEALPITHPAIETLTRAVVLLHSSRAAGRLGVLLDEVGVERRDIAIATISDAVDRAAGDGWRARTVALEPRDDALIAAARALID